MTPSERLLRDLIALPSVNPAFLPPGHERAGEQKVAAHLASVAGKAGLQVELRRVAGDRANLFATLTPSGKVKQTVMLAPHMDTVNGAENQFTPRVVRGKMFGRGACDTKGSVAAMMTAICEVARASRRPKETRIVFAGLLDEENVQAGSRHLASGGKVADLAIVGEPTRAKVVTAHKGSVWLEIEATGRAAHGAEPDQGVNAVHAMARIVDLLETEYRRQLKADRHPLLGSATSSVGTICGGVQPNIVPDRCTIWVDRRTLPGETEEGVVRQVQLLLWKRGCKAHVASRKQGPCLPLETDARLKLVALFMDAARQRQPLGAQYFCDASILASGGTPSVVFGPGDIKQAHTSDEWISLQSLEKATRILTRYLTSLP